MFPDLINESLSFLCSFSVVMTLIGWQLFGYWKRESAFFPVFYEEYAQDAPKSAFRSDIQMYKRRVAYRSKRKEAPEDDADQPFSWILAEISKSKEDLNEYSNQTRKAVYPSLHRARDLIGDPSS